MFADIEGYSKMMYENEARAIKLRTRQREVIEECVNLLNGEIKQYYGDGALIIFRSAYEAVQAAIRMQRKLRTSPYVPVRIGIHMGEVVSDSEGVYGNAVNIAARIEALSSAGGILISKKMNDELKNFPEVRSTLMGTFDLKNIAHSVDLYTVKTKGRLYPNLRFPLKTKLRPVKNLSKFVGPLVSRLSPKQTQNGWYS